MCSRLLLTHRRCRRRHRRRMRQLFLYMRGKLVVFRAYIVQTGRFSVDALIAGAAVSDVAFAAVLQPRVKPSEKLVQPEIALMCALEQKT